MIEWRWGLEPMTLRDRHAKNFAEALDFTKRRDAIDLPPFDAPPATACTEGGGRTQLSVSRKGWVEVLVRSSGGSGLSRPTRDGRRQAQELATAAEATVRGGDGVVLEMRLNKAGLTLLAEASNRARPRCWRPSRSCAMAPCAG